MTTLSPAETCRQVAYVIDSEPHRFNMLWWQHNTLCGAVACIAGHTALLHGDGLDSNPDLAHIPNTRNMDPNISWKYRQAKRLGLKPEASSSMFSETSSIWSFAKTTGNDRYSKVLRQLACELEDRNKDELVGLIELNRIAEEALR